MEEKEQLIEHYKQLLQTPFDRTGTAAEKYELRQKLFKTDDVLPMWVADMDLPTAPHIVEALQTRLEHPILGYTLATATTYQSIVNWHQRKGLECQPDQIEFTHNVLNGFHLAVQAFTQPGDAILVQPPVYQPFFKSIEHNNRVCVECPLVMHQQQYQMDFEALESAIFKHNVKLMLLCNPQNPSGRVWTRDELEQLAEICLRHNVVIISDEIHSSLTFKPSSFTPMASISTAIANHTVTLDSPGKAFNLGGLQIGYAIIKNKELLTRYRNIKKQIGIDTLNLFALTALETAYSNKNSLIWLDVLQQHILGNISTLKAFLERKLPKAELIVPQASYLVWIDFNKMFDDHQQLKGWLINEVEIGLNDGLSFGGQSANGYGFMRLNLAVSKQTLQECCRRIEIATAKIK